MLEKKFEDFKIHMFVMMMGSSSAPSSARLSTHPHYDDEQSVDKNEDE